MTFQYWSTLWHEKFWERKRCTGKASCSIHCRDTAGTLQGPCHAFNIYNVALPVGTQARDTWQQAAPEKRPTGMSMMPMMSGRTSISRSSRSRQLSHSVGQFTCACQKG